MKLLVVQVAALGHRLLEKNGGAAIGDLSFAPLEPPFPAVTCVAQASFRTGAGPDRHGVVANGTYSRRLRRPFFWEQASAIVEGERTWERFRRAGRSVGVLFWQQAIGDDADLILSPAPVHKHHGGMVESLYARPAALEAQLTAGVGRPFRLRHYWGPMASVRSSTWIAAATAEVMRHEAPDLLLTYLPHLDYDLQRWGPDSPKAARALVEARRLIGELAVAAGESGYELLVFGDYAIEGVSRAAFPNRALAEAGLLATREVRGMAYADLWASPAFAMVDHQVAHVYLGGGVGAGPVRECLAALEGVAAVLGEDERAAAGLAHPAAGDLVLRAAPGWWFAYPWWRERGDAPDFASHIDIHRKPGYDPCELFTSGWPFSISTDTARVRGSHGLVGRGREATWAATLDLAVGEGATLVDLAGALGRRLDREVAG